MTYKDTVMSDEQITQHELPDGDFDITGLCQAQAEISFTAGIREVVDWIRVKGYLHPVLPDVWVSPTWHVVVSATVSDAPVSFFYWILSAFGIAVSFLRMQE